MKTLAYNKRLPAVACDTVLLRRHMNEEEEYLPTTITDIAYFAIICYNFSSIPCGGRSVGEGLLEQSLGATTSSSLRPLPTAMCFVPAKKTMKPMIQYHRGGSPVRQPHYIFAGRFVETEGTHLLLPKTPKDEQLHGTTKHTYSNTSTLCGGCELRLCRA